MTSRRVAAALLALEGAAAVAGGIGFAVAALVRHPSDRGTAVLLGALLAMYGVAMLLVARGTLNARRWSRTPAYLIQFFALVVAWYQHATLPAVAAVIAAVAIAAVAALTKAFPEA
jgi:hypothetical protein